MLRLCPGSGAVLTTALASLRSSTARSARAARPGQRPGWTIRLPNQPSRFRSATIRKPKRIRDRYPKGRDGRGRATRTCRAWLARTRHPPSQPVAHYRRSIALQHSPAVRPLLSRLTRVSAESRPVQRDAGRSCHKIRKNVSLTAARARRLR